MKYSKIISCSIILLFSALSCTSDIDQSDSGTSIKETIDKALISPPQTIRHVRIVNNYPIFLKGKTIQVIRPSWIKNNPALNGPLLDVIGILNRLSGFDVEFSTRVPSNHKLTFTAITNQNNPSTCFADAIEPFQGNASGSAARIIIDDEVQLQHFLVVRSLFMPEIMHTLGFKHPDDTMFTSACSRADNWSGVMEPCVCSNSGNTFTCRNFWPNSCEAEVLRSLY